MSIRNTLLLLGLGYGAFIFLVVQLIFKSFFLSSMLGTAAGTCLFLTLALFAGASQGKEN